MWEISHLFKRLHPLCVKPAHDLADAIRGLALFAEPGDDPPRVLFGPAIVVRVVQQTGDGPPWLIGRAGAVAMRRPSHRRLDPPGMIPQRRIVRPLLDLRHRVLVGDRHQNLAARQRPALIVPSALAYRESAPCSLCQTHLAPASAARGMDGMPGSGRYDEMR